MSNIKILSAVLSFLLLFAISCSNEDTTGGNGGEDNGSLGYTHSNHPPEGDYIYYNHDTNKSYNSQTAIVKIVGGNCKITVKVMNVNNISDSMEYDITVTNWYTHPTYPNLNKAGTVGGIYGESTITKPTISLDYYVVEYDTSNKSISVSLQTTDGGAYYSALELTKD